MHGHTLTQNQERGISHCYYERHFKIEHQTKAGDHSQTHRQNPNARDPELVPHIIETEINSNHL